jgi:hypothetical protein
MHIEDRGQGAASQAEAGHPAGEDRRQSPELQASEEAVMRRAISSVGFWAFWTLNQVLAFFAIPLVWLMNRIGEAGESIKRWGARP